MKIKDPPAITITKAEAAAAAVPTELFPVLGRSPLFCEFAVVVFDVVEDDDVVVDEVDVDEELVVEVAVVVVVVVDVVVEVVNVVVVTEGSVSLFLP